MESIDPKQYGLPAQTVLKKTDADEFKLVIERKSRIIMKDAINILRKAEKIIKHVPDGKIVFETTAPVCSRSVKFLEKNDIKVIIQTIV